MKVRSGEYVDRYLLYTMAIIYIEKQEVKESINNPWIYT